MDELIAAQLQKQQEADPDFVLNEEDLGIDIDEITGTPVAAPKMKKGKFKTMAKRESKKDKRKRELESLLIGQGLRRGFRGGDFGILRYVS
jgi:hypothetical protein